MEGLTPAPGARTSAPSLRPALSARVDSYVRTPGPEWAPPTRQTLTQGTEQPPPPGDLPNLYSLDSGTVVRSGQPTAAGFAQLKAKGVKTIINLRAGRHCDVPDMAGGGFQYLGLPCADGNVSDDQLYDALSIMVRAENQPVAVHCSEGKHRTGYVIAMYRMLHDGWTVDRAIDEMESCGFADKYPDILQQLRTVDVSAAREKLATWPPPQLQDVP